MLAAGFRDRFSINNASFLQMNLFRPPFRDEAFDVVISNGVLHHTSDPEAGYRTILRKVKHGGFVIIGLITPLDACRRCTGESSLRYLAEALPCSMAACDD